VNFEEGGGIAVVPAIFRGCAMRRIGPER